MFPQSFLRRNVFYVTIALEMSSMKLKGLTLMYTFQHKDLATAEPGLLRMGI